MPEFDPSDFASFKQRTASTVSPTVPVFDPAELEQFRGWQKTPEVPTRFPVGATVGSIALPLLAGPMGVPASIGMGVLGAEGGEAYQQLYERARGKAAPATSGEAAKQIGEQAA